MFDLAVWVVFIGLVALFIWSAIYLEAVAGVDLWVTIFSRAIPDVWSIAVLEGLTGVDFSAAIDDEQEEEPITERAR